MKALKLLSLSIMPLFIFSFTSCKNAFVERDIEIKYLKVDPDKVDFESEKGTKILPVKTSFTFIDIEVDESWCDAELNDDNTELTINVGASDVPERTATITLTATDYETKVTVFQSALNDVKIPIVGAKPDRPEIYAAGNEIEKAWDVDAEGNGNPATWWITPNSGNTFPFDVVFIFDKAPKMDYLIYTPKQHSNASNVNGCLGRVEIWYTSAADAENAGDGDFTKYGEYDWGKSRELPGPTINFTPALENVTGIKLRIMEEGGGAAAGGYIAIGDIQFWKLGAGKSMLNVSHNSLPFEIGGGEKTVEVTATNLEGNITAESSEGWCTVNLVEGEITVNVEANDAADATERSCTITVSGGGLAKEITVTQAAPQLTPASRALLFETTAEEKLVNVTTNLTGVAVSKPDRDTWYTAVFDDDKLTVNVIAGGDAMRTSEITLTASNGTVAKIAVAQKGLNDNMLTVDSSWAQTFNEGNEVDKSHDGKDNTWYMANYQTTFPVDVVYYFRNVDRINHFIYHAKTNNANGRLGKVEVFYSTIAYPTPDPEAAFTSAGVFDWGKTADIRVVKFDEPITNPTAIKLRILEAGGGSSATTIYAGIKEIEFYKVGNEPTPIFELSQEQLEFSQAADSKEVVVTTNLTGDISATVPPADTWCTPTVIGNTITVEVTATTEKRETTITVVAPKGITKQIKVVQQPADTKLVVTGATPASESAYSNDNRHEKAYDVDGEGKGNAATWWIMKQSGNVYPYDFIFHLDNVDIDYLVYTPKQHSSASNVNGCLGRVEIWYTSAANPADKDAQYTKHSEQNWEKRRDITGTVNFTPALRNVTGIKFRIMEPGGNTTTDDGWAGIGDVSFFKKAE